MFSLRIPQAPALLKPQHQIFWVISETHIGEVLPFCRDTVGVFCTPTRRGHKHIVMFFIRVLLEHQSSYCLFVLMFISQAQIALLSFLFLAWRNNYSITLQFCVEIKPKHIVSLSFCSCSVPLRLDSIAKNIVFTVFLLMAL